MTPIPDFTGRLHNDTVVDSAAAARDFDYLLGALRSKAPGMWVDNKVELTRHFTSSIFLALNTMCNQAAAAEMRIMEITDDPEVGDVELGWDEPAVQLFDQPNGDDDGPDYIYSTTQQLGLTGSALLWYPGMGDDSDPSWSPTESYVIPTATALPWPPSPVYPNGSYLVQPYWPYGPFSTVPSYQSAAGARIPAEQIVHIKNQHPLLRYSGYSALTAMQRQVDTIEAIDLSRLTTQQKGVDCTVALTMDPEILKPNQIDMERLRKQIEAVAAGPQNAGKILFIPAGIKADKISNAPAEMAWTEGWNQELGIILAAFGTPKAVAGMSDDTSFANLFASLKQYYILSLQPLLRKLGWKRGGKLTRRILRPYFGSRLYLSLTPERIDDRDLLEKQLSLDVQAGNVRKVNEYRKHRGLPPLDGPEGEAFVGKQQDKEGGEIPVGMTGKPEDLQSGYEGDRTHGRLNSPLANERNRTKNPAGKHAIGPRKSYHEDRLAAALDTAKHNGHASRIDKYDDGAAEFLRKSRR